MCFDIPDKVFDEAVRDFEAVGGEGEIIIFDQSCNSDKWIEENF